MKKLKNVIFSAALSFTLITYLMSLFVRVSDTSTFVLTFESMSRFLIFSIILGLAGLIHGISKMPKSVARILHFIVLCADFCLVIATLPYGNDFRMIFASLLIFMIIYWVIIGICAAAKNLFSDKGEK